MGVQRVLAIIGTKITEYVGLQASAGAGSAGQLIALNASGVVDPTMIPPGQVNTGTDNNAATNGVFGIGAGVVANVDLGLMSDPVTQVSDLGLMSSPVTTTIDLGLFSA